MFVGTENSWKESFWGFYCLLTNNKQPLQHSEWKSLVKSNVAWMALCSDHWIFSLSLSHLQFLFVRVSSFNLPEQILKTSRGLKKMFPILFQWGKWLCQWKDFGGFQEVWFSTSIRSMKHSYDNATLILAVS